MMSPKKMDTASERYDQALEYGHHCNLPADYVLPKPTKFWPPENVDLLERYAAWLRGGGASEFVIHSHYIPMAGHVLGLALKPYPQLDPDADLQPALEFIAAKGVSEEWKKGSRTALARFKRFLLHERGQLEIKRRPYQPQVHTAGLPAWLVEELIRYQHLKQCNWRAARLEENIDRFWSGHLRVWRFLVERFHVQDLSDVRRKQLFDYQDHRISVGSSVSTINADLRSFHGFLSYLQEQGHSVPQVLLRIPGLKQPERLPKHLTDEQVRSLRDYFEVRLAKAQYAYQRRDALLDRACFYLLWQCGLRRGEVEELRLEDLELSNRKLSVRNGKGMKDRTVYLSDTALRALAAYLSVRGPGLTDHVFLFRNQPLYKDLIYGRLKAAGAQIGARVYAHRLRHTCGTQLLNSGCPVTSIQKLLGHKKLNTTMIYARAHDQTVEQDYFAAMGRIEQRMELISQPVEMTKHVGEAERSQLSALAERLFTPEMSYEIRLEIAVQMRVLLDGRNAARVDWIPPPVPVLANAEIA